MNNFPGMQDTAIIIAVILALLAGALIITIFAVLRPPAPVVFHKNQDIKGIGDHRGFVIARRERTAWFGGIVVTLLLIGVTSWTAQRDDAARYADAAPIPIPAFPLKGKEGSDPILPFKGRTEVGVGNSSLIPHPSSLRSNDPLDRLIARTRCRATDHPLEQFVIAIGSEADKGRPTISCVYITADLGVRPKLSYERPVIAVNSER